MKYFIKCQGSPVIIGPFTIEEIEARLKTGELSGDALATADTGESPDQATGWLCLHQLPGVGGNPPMPRLFAKQQAIYPAFNRHFNGDIADGGTFCRICSARVVPGETLCRKCAEHTAPAEKRSAAPHPLIVLFIQVPGGFLIHLVSFIFFCAMGAMFGGGYKPPNGMLVFVAVIHTLAWIAYAIRVIRNPAEQGIGFGVLIGVCLTGLLTGSCALK